MGEEEFFNRLFSMVFCGGWWVELISVYVVKCSRILTKKLRETISYFSLFSTSLPKIPSKFFLVC